MATLQRAMHVVPMAPTPLRNLGLSPAYLWGSFPRVANSRTVMRGPLVPQRWYCSAKRASSWPPAVSLLR